jgi:hypothetical protein
MHFNHLLLATITLFGSVHTVSNAAPMQKTLLNSIPMFTFWGFVANNHQHRNTAYNKAINTAAKTIGYTYYQKDGKLIKALIFAPIDAAARFGAEKAYDNCDIVKKAADKVKKLVGEEIAHNSKEVLIGITAGAITHYLHSFIPAWPDNNNPSIPAIKKSTPSNSPSNSSENSSSEEQIDIETQVNNFNSSYIPTKYTGDNLSALTIADLTPTYIKSRDNKTLAGIVIMFRDNPAIIGILSESGDRRFLMEDIYVSNNKHYMSIKVENSGYPPVHVPQQ